MSRVLSEGSTVRRPCRMYCQILKKKQVIFWYWNFYFAILSWHLNKAKSYLSRLVKPAQVCFFCPGSSVTTVGPYETNVRGYENVSIKTWKILFSDSKFAFKISDKSHNFSIFISGTLTLQSGLWSWEHTIVMKLMYVLCKWLWRYNITLALTLNFDCLLIWHNTVKHTI
jgi:hypothetical protein